MIVSLNICNAYHTYALALYSLAIVIGFVDTSYTVNETIGMLKVDVRVFNPPDDLALPATVNLIVEAVSGSASKSTNPAYLTYWCCLFISWRKRLSRD